MNTIHELAKLSANFTDKQNPDHSFAGQSYLHYYERHLENLRDKPIKLLEIGVLKGCSLRLWRDYFTLGDIHGLDQDPACKAHEGERITVHTGGQAEAAVLQRLSNLGPWDVIIDDGSHKVPHLITSYCSLFGQVKSGGFYVLEDMAMSYLGTNKRVQLDAFLLGIMRTMDTLKGDVRAMHVYPMVIFMEKK